MPPDFLRALKRSFRSLVHLRQNYSGEITVASSHGLRPGETVVIGSTGEKVTIADIEAKS